MPADACSLTAQTFSSSGHPALGPHRRHCGRKPNARYSICIASEEVLAIGSSSCGGASSAGTEYAACTVTNGPWKSSDIKRACSRRLAVCPLQCNSCSVRPNLGAFWGRSLLKEGAIHPFVHANPPFDLEFDEASLQRSLLRCNMHPNLEGG